MPTARIVTRFPERAASLRKTLSDSGYHVEVVRPEHSAGPADLEYLLDDMPEFAAAPETPVGREFVLAPHWRALKARFSREHAQQVSAASLPSDPPRETPASVSPSQLDSHFIDKATRGPAWGERLDAVRRRLADTQQQLRQTARDAWQRFEHQRRQRRLAATEARRIREQDLAARREAERLAAERARGEAAIRRAAQQERASQRLAELEAQAEARRRQEQQERAAAQQRARIEAEQRARLEAERLRAAAMYEAPPSRLPGKGAPFLFHRLDDLRRRLSQAFREWRETQPSARFLSTRDYAYRQSLPAAFGIALAFFLGWAIAMGGPRKVPASTPVASQPATPAAVPAAVMAPAAVAKQPSGRAQRATVTTKQKSAVSRSRSREDEDEVVWKDEEDDGEEVVVIHHYPGKSSIAQSRKKNGVRTISDLEED